MPTLIERGFRRGWADAASGYDSAALRFHSDFLTGYFDGYRVGQQSKIGNKSLDEALQEWSNR